MDHDLHVGLYLSELGHRQSQSLHALRLGNLVEQCVYVCMYVHINVWGVRAS